MITCIVLPSVNLVLQEPLLLIVFMFGCLFHQNFEYGLQHSCVCCIWIAKLYCQPLCLANIQSFISMNAEFKMFPLELVPSKAPWQPALKRCWPCLSQLYHFQFDCCRLTDSPTSYIEKTQATIAWSSSFVITRASLGFLNLVFPYK